MAIIGEMKKLTIGGSTYTIPEYSLPIASASILGGVKIGSGLSINSTTGVLSATGGNGTITEVATNEGRHTTIDITSGKVEFNVPTKTSHLTNDSGFLTSSDLASVLKYKGTKASVANLPTTDNMTGDVWHITADGSEYAWDGSIWQELGTAIDLSGYALKSELPTDTDTWRTIQVNGSDILGSGINTGKLNLKAGNAITLSESSGTVTFNHSDTSSQASSSNSGRTYIQSITLDTYGHVTGISTATETVTNTDEKVKVAALTSGTTYYPILATGTGTATRQIDSTLGGLKYISTSGSTSAVGTAILQLGNSTASGSANNEQGVLRVYTTNTRYVDIKTESTFAPTGSRNRYLPSYDADMYLTGTNTTNAVGGATTAPVYVDNTGCIQAVTSIPYSLLTGTPTIPTVPSSTGSSETGVTATTTATKTTLGTASSIYGVKSGTNSTTTASKASGSNGSASNWVFEDVACDDITAWSAGSGSASFSATVSSHVLSFSHSHTHTAPSLTYSGKTASHVKSGGNGTAPSWSFSDVTVPIRNDSATSVPSVSVASATVSISDPGHTHTI